MSEHTENSRWIERAARRVADLEVEVGSGRRAVGSWNAAARAENLSSTNGHPDDHAGRGEVSVPGEVAPGVADLDDEPVAASPTDVSNDARRHGAYRGPEWDGDVDSVVVTAASGDGMPAPAERGTDPSTDRPHGRYTEAMDIRSWRTGCGGGARPSWLLDRGARV